ncbi:TOBE domain-containing protein [Sedimenticola selenatireducens]|uniref:TOBE domain-containing protein n=1 Tax=Sedimenticola selenatireducens TaxID=191960 RepID=UPI002AAB6CAE|nr:TOBE domain-containing protein [Sedimenticola selenatireducens]
MKISARNQFKGTITNLKEGPISAEVELTTQGGDRVVAMVTDQSVRSLNLAPGKEVVALVKALSVPCYRYPGIPFHCS